MGYDTTPSRTRCQAIVNNVIGVFPEFAGCYDPSTAKFWAGLRPMAPPNGPYLGPTPLRNLFVNTGRPPGVDHVLRLEQAVADMVAGKAPRST